MSGLLRGKKGKIIVKKMEKKGHKQCMSDMREECMWVKSTEAEVTSAACEPTLMYPCGNPMAA